LVAVNKGPPPVGITTAILAIKLRWTSASRRKKSPRATTPSKVRQKKSESSTAAFWTGTVGKRAWKAAIMLGEASTPYTLNPRSIKVFVIGTPVPR
jgi:hypothetical protein